MIEGELYQLTKTGDVDITEEEHFEIIRRKTAFLFSGCAQIGGMLGNARRAGRGAARVRLQPRHRVPAGGRPARLHGR
jgi:octaprenyl-diphosphate synthase